MAFIPQIDGTNVAHISNIDWSETTRQTSLDLISVFNRWRICIWSVDQMPMSDWATLIGKRGSIVSITTTDPNNRNADFVTFYGARVQDVTKSNHLSLNAQGVKIEFLVRT